MAQRLHLSARGFTLIEILVVILVIGILVAVAAPSFLGQTDKAHDSAAKQYLTIAYKAARADTVARGNVFPIDTTASGSDRVAPVVSAIEASEGGTLEPLGAPDCSFAGPANTKIVVDFDDSKPGSLILYSRSKSGAVWRLSGGAGGGASGDVGGHVIDRVCDSLPEIPPISIGECDKNGSNAALVDCPPPLAPSGSRILAVYPSGDGRGTVSSLPAGIDCGDTCAYDYAVGTVVTLTAAAASGSTFSGWAGACEGAGTCQLKLEDDLSVVAVFERSAAGPFLLTVERQGSGTGVVASTAAGIACGADCQEQYPAGTAVELTATPGVDSSFLGWAGACYAAELTCSVTMDRAKDVVAVFAAAGAANPTLLVSVTGSGVGQVFSDPVGVACEATCASSYATGTEVVLTANPLGASRLVGWQGDGSLCAADPVCLVPLTESKHVVAVFARDTSLLPLEVSVVSSTGYAAAGPGPGQGAVFSADGKIICVPNCLSYYAPASQVTLYAVPVSGSAFDHWEGACTGTNSTCVVTMDAAKQTTAVFKQNYMPPPTCILNCTPPPTTTTIVCRQWYSSYLGGAWTPMGGAQSNCSSPGGGDGNPAPTDNDGPGGGPAPADPSVCPPGTQYKLGYAITNGEQSLVSFSNSFSCGNVPPTGPTTTVVCPPVQPCAVVSGDSGGGGGGGGSGGGSGGGTGGGGTGGTGDWTTYWVDGADWTPATPPTMIWSRPCPYRVPGPTSPPTIADPPLSPGTALVGKQGVWYGTPPMRFDYQWQRDAGSGFANIPGATSQSYDLQPADVGSLIRFQLTVTNSRASVSVFSSPTDGIGPVTPATAPANYERPFLSGTLADGGTLTLDRGAWAGTAPLSFAYQWQRSLDDGATWANVAGATGLSLTLSGSDIGKRFRALVTVSNAAGSAVKETAATAPVPLQPPLNTASPAISGLVEVASTLTAQNGTWTNSPTSYAHQWLRCSTTALSSCANIALATAQTYTVTAADEEKHLRVVVTAQNAAGSSSSTSGHTIQVASSLVAPTFVGANDVNGAYATSVSVAKPSGVQSGDFLLAHVHTGISGTPAASGWTLLRMEGSVNYRVAVFYKWAGASEPASYAFSGGAHWTQAAVAAYRGVDTANPVNASLMIAGGSTTSITTPSITTTVKNTRIVTFASWRFGGAVPTAYGPSGASERWTDSHSNDQERIAGADFIQSTQGAISGSFTFASGASNQIGGIVALTPAGGSAPVYTPTLLATATSNTNASSTSAVAVSKPPNVLAGDVMLVQFGLYQGGTVTAPSDWTQLNTGTTGGFHYVFYKVATASEPASYTFSFGAGKYYSYSLVAYTDTAASPIAASASATPAASTSLASPSVTVPTRGVALAWIGINPNTTFPPTFTSVSDGFTIRTDIHNSQAQAARQAFADKTYPAGGSAGPTWTLSANPQGPVLGTVALAPK